MKGVRSYLRGNGLWVGWISCGGEPPRLARGQTSVLFEWVFQPRWAGRGRGPVARDNSPESLTFQLDRRPAGPALCCGDGGVNWLFNDGFFAEEFDVEN